METKSFVYWTCGAFVAAIVIYFTVFTLLMLHDLIKAFNSSKNLTNIR